MIIITKAQRMEQYHRLGADAAQLFQERNTEYGDAFELDGLLGVLYEWTSVYARLRAMREELSSLEFGEHHYAPEWQARMDALRKQLHDKLLDGVNYSIMGLMLLEEGNFAGIPMVPVTIAASVPQEKTNEEQHESQKPGPQGRAR